MNIWAIILAGGKGTRFGEKKQFVELLGKPLYRYSLEILNRFVQGTILVVPKEDVKRLKKEEEALVVEGGEERYESSRRGLESLPKGVTHVLIHDASRPCITEDLVKNIVKHLEKGFSAVIPAIPVYDALKLCQNGFVVRTLEREHIFRAQTPQGFKVETLREGFKRLKGKVYDDSQLVEGFEKVRIIPGDERNIKITTREDLTLAASILREACSSPLLS